MNTRHCTFIDHLRRCAMYAKRPKSVAGRVRSHVCSDRRLLITNVHNIIIVTYINFRGMGVVVTYTARTCTHTVRACIRILAAMIHHHPSTTIRVHFPCTVCTGRFVRLVRSNNRSLVQGIGAKQYSFANQGRPLQSDTADERYIRQRSRRRPAWARDDNSFPYLKTANVCVRVSFGTR